MDNFLDNLIYEIAIMGVLRRIFRQDNFLTIYERFWHLGGHVRTEYRKHIFDKGCVCFTYFPYLTMLCLVQV